MDWAGLLKPEALDSLGAGAALVVGLVVVLRFMTRERAATQRHQEALLASVQRHHQEVTALAQARLEALMASTQSHQEQQVESMQTHLGQLVESMQTWHGNHLSHLYTMQEQQVQAMATVRAGLEGVRVGLAAVGEVVRECAGRGHPA